MEKKDPLTDEFPGFVGVLIVGLFLVFVLASIDVLKGIGVLFWCVMIVFAIGSGEFARVRAMRRNFDKINVVINGQLWDGSKSEVIHKRSPAQSRLTSPFRRGKKTDADRLGGALVGMLSWAKPVLRLMMLGGGSLDTIFLCITEDGRWFVVQKSTLKSGLIDNFGIVSVSDDYAREFLGDRPDIYCQYFKLDGRKDTSATA